MKLFSKDNGKHLVQYDDAEEELLDLGEEKIEWVQETVKTLKRLRRGPLSTSNEVVVDGHVVMEDEDKEGSNDVADDDSSDEDWGKSGDKDLVAEEEEELMELEDEEDDEVPTTSTNKGKRGLRSKRKLKGGGNLGSAKKTKCDKDVMEPTPNVESKYWDFKCVPYVSLYLLILFGDKKCAILRKSYSNFKCMAGLMVILFIKIITFRRGFLVPLFIYLIIFHVCVFLCLF